MIALILAAGLVARHRRLFAKVLVAMGAASDTDVGMYALLGAAGFLGGLMRMSAAQVRSVLGAP